MGNCLKRTVWALVFMLTGLAMAGTAWAQASAVDDKAQRQSMDAGIAMLTSNRLPDALAQFQAIAARYEAANRDNSIHYFCARTPDESAAYVAEAAQTSAPTKAVSDLWAYSYYYQAYTLVLQGNNFVGQARQANQKALNLSPHNSQFWAQQGTLQQRVKDWNSAMQSFQRSEDEARAYSPANMKKEELAVAWRGMAYIYVELGNVSEARRLYNQCLAINPDDAIAASELRYIDQLPPGGASSAQSNAPATNAADTAAQR